MASITTLERITRDREARAAERAAALKPANYRAFDKWVEYYDRDNKCMVQVLECETHWDACLVLLALGTRNQ